MDRTYYSKSDPLVVIIIKNSTKLRCQLCAVNVRLQFVHCCYELELKANTGIVKQRYSSLIYNELIHFNYCSTLKTSFNCTGITEKCNLSLTSVEQSLNFNIR